MKESNKHSYLILGANSSLLVEALVQCLINKPEIQLNKIYLIDTNASSFTNQIKNNLLDKSLTEDCLCPLDINLADSDNLAKAISDICKQDLTLNHFCFFTRYIAPRSFLDSNLESITLDVDNSIVAALLLVKAIYKSCAKKTCQKLLTIVNPYIDANEDNSPFSPTNSMINGGLNHIKKAFKDNNTKAKISMVNINTIYPEQDGLNSEQRVKLQSAFNETIFNLLKADSFHFLDQSIDLNYIP